MQISTHTSQGVDKLTRYKWAKLDQPGQFQHIDKSLLRIDDSYQRQLTAEKVKTITAEWSWMAFGVIVVAKRSQNYYAIDGQHRVTAALRRSDITALPCMVFRTQSVEEEASGFLTVNTCRKPISSIGRHKASVAAGNPLSIFIESTINELGLRITGQSARPREIKCIGWCHKYAAEDRETFKRVLALVTEMADVDATYIPERVLAGVWHLHKRCGAGLNDKRLVQRLKEKGANAALEAANRAAAYYAAGGAAVWAQGILNLLNKGLQKKFTMRPSDDEVPA